MMNRKTKAQEINDIIAEMKLRQRFLEIAVNKIEGLKTIAKLRRLTDAEIEQGVELQDLARGHVAWINKHKGEVSDFYQPAIR